MYDDNFPLSLSPTASFVFGLGEDQIRAPSKGTATNAPDNARLMREKSRGHP